MKEIVILVLVPLLIVFLTPIFTKLGTLFVEWMTVKMSKKRKTPHQPTKAKGSLRKKK